MQPSPRTASQGSAWPPSTLPSALQALDAAHVEISQLQRALDTRIVIEQAKGYLAASADVSPAVAFLALRAFSRDRNLKLRHVSRDLLAGTLVAREALISMARDDRLTAARETAQSLVARSHELLVAARVTLDESFWLLGHALPDIGALTATKGVTLCTLVAGDEVGLIPDLLWEQLSEQHRCITCAEAATTQGA